MNCPKCGEGNPEGAKFCSQCRTDLTDLSGYDQPEAEEKYREILIDLLGDGILEDWEEKSLEKSREKLKISFTRSKQIQEELGGSNDAPPPIAIYLDIAQIKKFQVGGTCVFSFLFKNQIEEGLRSVSLTFEDTDTSEPLSVKTKPIGPNQEARQQKIIKIHQFGAHEITGIVTVVPVLGEPEQFKLEPLLYDVTGNDQPGQTNVTIDMSAARVIDASDLKIGSSTASGASVVTDKDSEWYQLELIRVSAGVQTFKQEQEKLKVGQGNLTNAREAEEVVEITSDAASGQDTVTYDDGSKYVGELKDGVRHGQGTYTCADGETYIGEWKDGARNGQGTNTWPDGNKYVGEFKDNMLHGQCTYTFADGSEYVGEWKDGARNGQGTNTWPDGSEYVGEWKDDMRQGQGTYTWPDGSEYVGEWKDNMQHGQGNMTYADGSEYVGKWKDDKRNGKGQYRDLKGTYIGQWKDDCYNGHGRYVSKNFEVYEGEWKDGMQNGQGTYSWGDGREYVGEWKDGMQHGQGTETNEYDDGSKYVGEWKDGARIGQGTETLPDGRVEEGIFEDNKFTEAREIDEQQSELKVKNDSHIAKYTDIAKKYWYLSVPSGALSGLVSFMLIHNQVGWDSWYWSIIAGVVGFLFAFLYSVPFLVIALVIGVIWSVVKGIDFLQDKGVLEKKIEEQVIEDKVEDGVKNRQEKTPAREDMGIWEADKKEVLQ